MAESLEVVEREAEWYSLYVRKLRSQFSRRDYFLLLKDFLVKKFGEQRLREFGQVEDALYFVVDRDTLLLLEGFVKEYINFAKGRGHYYEDYVKKMEDEFYGIISSYAKHRRDTYLLEVAIRKFLIHSSPDEEILGSIIGAFNSVLSSVKESLRKSKVELESFVSSFISRGIFLKIPLEGINFKSFAKRVGKDKQWIVDILIDYSNDLKWEPVNVERRKKLNLDLTGNETDRLRKRLLDFLTTMKNELEEKIPPVYVVDRLSRLESTLRVHMGAARGLLYAQEEAKEDFVSQDFHVPRILGYIGFDANSFIPSQVKDKIEKDIEKGKYELPEEYSQKRIFKKVYDFDRIWREFQKFYLNVLEPTIYHKIIEEMIELWPVPSVKKTTIEEARWVGLKARTGDVIFVPPRNIGVEKKRVDLELYRLGNVVSVLIYDIRGSTFMGEKLRNARKEEEIRRKFQERLIRVAEHYGGFPLKDTGDGGIIFFSGNSHELFEKFQEIRLGETPDYSVKLYPSRYAARQAVFCARDMVKEAENFVKENLENYKEWFKSVEGVELQFRGITYEKLPPSFRKIFQIGVGVASGDPETDLSFNINAFGEPDITGNLVRYANTYSKAKEKEGSVIMIDARTTLSFLLSLEKFEEFDVDTKIDDVGFQSNVSLLLTEMERWFHGFHGKYHVEKYGIGIMKVVERLYRKIDRHEDVEVKEEGFEGLIRPEKAFKDIKSGRLFALYKIIPKGG